MARRRVVLVGLRACAVTAERNGCVGPLWRGAGSATNGQRQPASSSPSRRPASPYRARPNPSARKPSLLDSRRRVVPLSLPSLLQYLPARFAPTRHAYLPESPRPHVCHSATGFDGHHRSVRWRRTGGFGGSRRNKSTQFATPAKGRAPGARRERSGAERFVASGGGDDEDDGRSGPPVLPGM
ncbi:unnamed protein product [Urochloa humidicola]